MKRRRTLFVVLVLQLLVGALAIAFLPGDDSDDNGAPGTNEPELTGSQALLSGVVTDQDTKKPIPGAVIKIDHAAGPSTVRTSNDGRYRAVVDASRPIGFTIDAPGHKGAVAFGKLCPKERRDVPIALPSAASPGAPPAPVVLEEKCG